MAINPHQTVIGLFDERGMADKAVNDLQNAGFSAEQMYYSGPDEHDDLAKQLRDLGCSDAEINNYQNQYDIGRTVVAVKARGREDEALAILRTDGAHS